MMLLMNSGFFLHFQNKTLFFFEIPDNVKIISVTVTKLIVGKMTPKHSMDVMNTFSVIYLKRHKCHNFTQLEQKRVLSSTYFTGSICATGDWIFLHQLLMYSYTAWEKAIKVIFKLPFQC